MDRRIQYPFKDDHEVFIALIAEFNGSIGEISRQVTANHEDTTEIKNLLQQQYEHLSERIDKVEKDLIALNPEELARLKADVRENKEYIANFKRTKHIAWVVASVGFALLGHYLPPIFKAVETLFSGGNW